MVDNIASSVSESYCGTVSQIQGSGGSPRKQQWCELGVHNYVKVLIIGALFYYLFRGEIRRIVHRWLTDSSWSHGFLIPFFSLYFINQAKSKILNLQTKPNYLGLFFLICCLGFYPFVIYVLRLGYPASVLMILTLGSVVLFLRGWGLVKCTWLAITYLVFAIPLPPWLYREVTIPMRILAAQVAAVLLNFVTGMEANASGVVIDVIYKGVRLEPALDVAEACSGMRLLMASTIPIAILCNIVRVTVTGFIYILIHPKYAQGIYHDFLGMAMLPLAFGFYGFLAWFMSSLFVEETEVAENIVIRRQK
jgi:exosortase